MVRIQQLQQQKKEKKIQFPLIVPDQKERIDFLFFSLNEYLQHLKKQYVEIAQQQHLYLLSSLKNIKNKLIILQKKLDVFLSVLQALHLHITFGVILALPNDTPQQLKRKIRRTQSLLYSPDQSAPLAKKTQSIQRKAIQLYNDIAQFLVRLQQQTKQQQSIRPPSYLTRS